MNFFLLHLNEIYLLKQLVFKTFAVMELNLFNSIHGFFIFSSVSMKQSEVIQVYRLTEVLSKRVLILFG